MNGAEVASPVVVPETLAGERVDRALALLTGWSRREVRTLIDDGTVTVDGRVASRSARLEAGATLAWSDAPEPATLPQADASVPIVVVYEDDDLVVIDKAPGLVVHPGAGHREGTLVHGLLARYDLEGVGDPERPGIVHRLDRETSGLLVVARTPAAYEALVAALAAHEVERRYDAVVLGVPEATQGTVDAPIGRSVRNPTRMSVRAGGRAARTHYEVVTRFDEAARLAVALETGRTHQIRVHLAAIGHPVWGDPVYGRPDPRVGRPFLHAAELEFTHPVSGAPVHCTTPWPEDLTEALATLGPAR